MPPQQPNQYDFIMSHNAKPRRSFNFGNSTTSRLIIVIIGLLLIIVAAAVINSFLNSGNKDQAARLTEVAKAQNEIIRVSALADQKAKTDEVRDYAVTTRYAVSSSQQETKQLLAARGVKGKGLDKSLSASKNTKTDEILDEATRNNRYDETFRAVMEQQIADYQKLLQAAFDSGTAGEKRVLTTAFESAGRLTAKPASTQ